MSQAIDYHHQLMGKIKHQINLEEQRFLEAEGRKDPLAKVYLEHANALKSALHYVEVWSPANLKYTTQSL